VEVPDIQYARSGDVAVAYQVVGDGPVDVVWFRGMAGDLLSTWDQSLIVRHAIGLAAFRRASELGNAAWLALLEQHHALIRRRLRQLNGEEIDTAGDGFSPLSMVRGGRSSVRAHWYRTCARLGLRSVLVFTPGSASAVRIGARVAAEARPAEVLVSSTVKDLVAGSEIRFEDRGLHELKGVAEWRLYAVSDELPSE
jgi:hypothetical protein